MIKINLAKKKQAAYSGGEAAPKGSSFSLGASTEGAGPVLFKILLPVILSAVSYFAYHYWLDMKNEEMKIELSNLSEEKTRNEQELQKYSGFEAKKSELDQTQQMINLKIDTIEKLIRGKDNTVKSVIALSQALPKEVWLNDLNVTETGYMIRGQSLEMSLVSDFMSKLNASIYYKDVTLKSSVSDPAGNMANFELSAVKE